MKKWYGKLPKHWYCETWKENFYYCLGWPEKIIQDYLLWKANYKTNFNCDGKTLEIEEAKGSIILIWTRNKTDYASFVHECAHAAGFALDKKGYKYDPNNDEPFTYLVESIFRYGVKK